MHDILVPITFFLAVAIITVSFMFFNSKSKKQLQETLQLAIEKGETLSPETIEKLLDKKRPFADLKRGIIFIAFGIAFALFGIFSPAGELETKVMIGFSMFPIIIGFAYILVFKLHEKFES